MNRSLLIFSIFVLSIFIIAGCGDSITEHTPSIIDEENSIIVTSKFSEIQSEIFNKSCAFSGCHVSGSISPNLSGNSYDNIVNKISSVGSNYIKPNDPSNSYLLQKLLGSNSINGSRMPLNSSPLSDEKIQSIIDWINDGAENN